MINQFLILKKICKEKKIFVFFFILIFIFINLINIVGVDGINIHSFNVANGNIFEKDLVLYEILWILYQLFFFLYLAYQLFIYDEDNSQEFLLLRKPYKKIILEKSLVLVLFIIIVKLAIGLGICPIYGYTSFLNIFYNIFFYLILIVIAFILSILNLFIKNK